MWFAFPSGCSGISVELQQFVPEVKGEDGREYFRAPDHFAPRILEIKGFAIANDLPANAPADLPKADPLRDNAITELTAASESQKREIQSLREDVIAGNSTIVALRNDNAKLAEALKISLAKIEELEEQIYDKPAAPITPPVAKKI